MASPTGVSPTIVILDDEQIVREMLKVRIEKAGYTAITASNYREFTRNMVDCDAVLCDIFLPGQDGLQALEWTRQHFPNTAVIMMTGNPTYKTAAEAIRLGAFDYLAKPIRRDNLLITLKRAVKHRALLLEREQLERENQIYRRQLEERVLEQTQALRESEQFLTTLTDTMADAVFSLSMPGYRIEYVNQAVGEIFGYTPDELLGQTIQILHTDQTSFNTFSQRQITAIAAGQSEMRMEQPMRKKDGKIVSTEIVSTFLHTEEEQPNKIISVVRDITQRSFLLGVVAHELRSPLSLVTGFSQAVLDDIDNMDRDSISRYLGFINDSTGRVFKIVDDLLDLTKIELGQVTLNIEPVDLVNVLKTHAGDYAYVAIKKNLTLKEIFSPESLNCHCDAIKIGQVVSNFIDNAIKYSDLGATIEIIGKQNNDTIWVGVKDEGPGIKPEEVQHLFKGFGHKNISSTPTAGEKSSGLGLAICKRIIEAHGGKIGAESAPNQGSTFWFSLPMEANASTSL